MYHKFVKKGLFSGLVVFLLVVVPSIAHSLERQIEQDPPFLNNRMPQVRQSFSGIAPQASKQPNYVEGEVLVKFKPDNIDLNKQKVKYTLTSFYRVHNVSESAKLYSQNIVLLKSKTKTTAELIARLQKDPAVAYAEPNYLQYLEAVPNDTEYSKLWGMNNIGQTVNGTAGTIDADIDASEAWDLSTGSSLVTVAVIDSGIASGHPDLSGNLVTGYDFVNNDSTPEDLNDHGTHVAGAISAIGNNATGVVGVSWNIKIMPLRALGADGSGTTANIASAVTYAAQHGANIINMSLGGSGYSQTLYDALATARTAGVLVVIAAGNGGLDGVGDNNDGGTHTYPCDYDLDNIICVAATDQNDLLASFSNYGTTSVDVAAPGVNIYSTVPYRPFSENFDGATKPGFTGTQFTSSGSGNYWMTYGTTTDTGAYGDSNSYAYQNNSNGIISLGAVDTTISDLVYLQYDYAIESEDDGTCTKDYLLVQVYNGSTWTGVKRYCGIGTSGTETIDISSYKNAAMQARFQWVTNGSDNNYFGAAIDNVKILAPNAANGSYDFMQGTSMATPYVAGLSALLKSSKPTFSYLGIKNTILNNVDAKGLPVVSGGRINAFVSLFGVDSVAPTATVGYSTTAATNQNVTATLTPSETILVTNNGGDPSYTFTSNGSFEFTFTDLAGNSATTTATVSNIDKTAPIITVASYTTTPTNQDITVTATTNEGTLNAASYTFTANGSFDFVATDAAGNSTTSTVTITNIDKTAPTLTLIGNSTIITKPGSQYVDPGAVAVDGVDGDISGMITVSTNLVTSTVGEYNSLFSVTDRAGNTVTATRNIIVAAQSTAITVTKGAYTTAFNGKKRTIRPLGEYTGKVLARKMIVKKYNQPIYVFIPLDAQASPNIVVVDYKGKVVRRTSLKTFSTKGFNADAVTDGVHAFFAVGTAAPGTSARVYRVTETATQLIRSLSQSTKGKVFVKFLKLFSTSGQQYGLVTAIKGKTTSVRVWRYSVTAKAFSRLTTYDVKKIILSNAGLSVKAGTALVP